MTKSQVLGYSWGLISQHNTWGNFLRNYLFPSTAIQRINRYSAACIYSMTVQATPLELTFQGSFLNIFSSFFFGSRGGYKMRKMAADFVFAGNSKRKGKYWWNGLHLLPVIKNWKAVRSDSISWSHSIV